MAGKYTEVDLQTGEGYEGNEHGKYTEGLEADRGIQELQGYLKSLPEQSDVSALLKDANELVHAAAKAAANQILSESQLIGLLQAMISDTPFARATIRMVDSRPNAMEYTGETLNVSNNETVGNYASAEAGTGGCFNVNFRYENDQWYLDYSPVPVGGNTRA